MTSPPGDEPTNPRPRPEPEPAEPFTLPYAPPPDPAAMPYRIEPIEADPYQPAVAARPKPYIAPLAEPVHFPPEIWLVFVSAAVAIAGAFVPWFDPYGTDVLGHRVLRANHAVYSWQDGRIGLLAPVLLVVFAIGILRMMRGTKRFAASKVGPVTGVGLWALVVGALTVGCVLVANALLPGQFDTPAAVGGTWSSVKAYGITMSRNPQTGLWLTLTAAGLCVLCGIALIVSGTRHRPAGR